MIQIRSLSKTFVDGIQSKTVLDNLDLSVHSGTSIALTGESGSGKSTLLNILATLDKADSGQVIVDSQNVAEFTEKQADQFRKQKIGMVFQKYNLIDSLNIKDNISLPARLNDNLDQDYLNELVEVLKISALLDKMPNNLSGGEQQRVAIARALSHQPKLLFADEPTGNLDDENSRIVAELLVNLCQRQSTTLLLVTHSHDLAARAATHVHLKDGKLQTLRC